VLKRQKFKDVVDLYDYLSEQFLDFRELSLDEVTDDMLKAAEQARTIPQNRLHNL
jgi:hypothetical protein